jgi:hypothetical protein
MPTTKRAQVWFDSEARFSATMDDNVEDLPLMTLKVKRIQPRTYKNKKDFDEYATSILDERFTGEHLMIDPGSILHLSKTFPTFNSSSRTWECKQEDIVVARVESYFYTPPSSHVPLRNGTIKIFGLATEI